MTQPARAYADAGVNLDAADQAKLQMREAIRTTHGPEVLGGMGGFGGLFAIGSLGLRDPVLVSSIDGVGTKLKIAFTLDRHESVGKDLVAHCVNDILVCGARPLFFLDYLALGAMDGDQAVAVVRGVAEGCREAGCALIGGETAAMPGFYAPGEYDLAGAIVGVVERERIITGQQIRAGDIAVGFPSLGLHTNGYALARKALANDDLAATPPELGRSLGDELLQPHRCYLNDVAPLLEQELVAGMAHITGGGLVDNVPRVLPDGLGVDFDATTWDIPPIFRLIQQRGAIQWDEMARVFNLGIGFVVFTHPEHLERTLALSGAAGARPIGSVRAWDAGEAGTPRVRVEGLA
ncbi:MAG TPA: phosphoribosylformylglycinamidine cyclo-ligase [Ktedonobacterales bacterium]|jgi:phosphoribosylformylglycinamidine cyclo-ligase|nr:phosphoribosylformylglycinamidine cyclo-ligase [Ktedonobacterales bacterium]